MNQITEWIQDINLCYFIFVCLSIIVLNIYLKRFQAQKSLKWIINIVYLIIHVLTFNYFNGILNNIFDLSYLSVKLYLIIIVITNCIFLKTINQKTKVAYSVLNYILFALLTIIFGATLAIILGNKYESFYIMDVANAVNFIDLSFVIFLIYLIVICLVTIGYELFEKNTSKELNLSKWNLSNIKIPNIEPIIMKFQKKFHNKEKTNISTNHQFILTEEELLNYNLNNGLYIDGVECSIIFEDSNQDNIIKNYHILLNDIHARLVNGYTLEENQMLKSICTKLQVSTLSHIDISNVSILNKISIEEYNLLRKVFGLN